MEDDFYASIKLKTGEEIFARVLPCDENNKINLLVTNPIIIESIKGRNGSQGYKIEPWMKTTTEDMFLIKMEDVITMTETNDVEMITMHQSYIRKISDIKNNKKPITRKMGYLANVNDAKELLEKIYKNL
jgi:hypothetical protein